MTPQQNILFAIDLAIVTIRVYCSREAFKEMEQKMNELRAMAIADLEQKDKP
jgi:hypothetical protein